ncbi:glutamate--cysteine ligase [Leptospira idonii]|uniref:Glutamate--cysteine ligase n=1 Tax=Leptospira idonii TaxID=1193500 RepID=A0A4V3JY39_9LEPT|nr:glutamate--cysteine ligase [Leptospira idonii]TGN18396.1 glutamate--cysteine ligase [Leptospira idonii]
MTKPKLLSRFYKKTAKTILKENYSECLSSAKHGLERETLRVDGKGQISKKNHPQSLGSALTHPLIKTDFAEPQVEYATGAYKTIEETMGELTELHAFTLRKLDGETLWPFSMPGPLPSEDKIPVGLYGTSKEGRKKTIYRKGLGNRYGRKMQTISGVHYNLSFDKCLLSFISDLRYKKPLTKETQSQIYFDTIRNFNRISPVLLYFFGASSLIDESFHKEDKNLSSYRKKTLYSPFATTLRLSSIGYTSAVQGKHPISVNSLKDYSYDMCAAVSKPYSGYSSISEKEQLNDHYLQIENEYYSLVRPKQVPHGDERVLDALMERGVEYLEIRLLDVDPFSPVGVEENRLYFIHLLLLHCLLSDSPKADRSEMKDWKANQEKVTWNGRNPKTSVQFMGEKWNFSEFIYQVLVELQPIADILDRNDSENGKYSKAWEAQWEKWNDPGLLATTISELDLNINKMSYAEFGLKLSQSHAQYLKEIPISLERMQYFEDMAEQSLYEQKKLENLEGSHLKKNQKPIELKPLNICSGTV